VTVVLGSIFRNSTGYLSRYFSQVAGLAALLHSSGSPMRLLWVEGDSTDGTWDALREMAGEAPPEVELIKCDHGGPLFGSVDNAERWRNISRVCNALLDCVRESDEALIYVESDLIWEPATMLRLLDHLEHVPAVAPMCYWQPTAQFYDVWGHRGRDGQRFSPHPPYHPSIAQGALTPIQSAGSCLVMRGNVARTCRFAPPDEGIVGFGKQISSRYGLWLDSSQRVIHP
jgi:hypothetical protein